MLLSIPSNLIPSPAGAEDDHERNWTKGVRTIDESITNYVLRCVRRELRTIPGMALEGLVDEITDSASKSAIGIQKCHKSNYADSDGRTLDIYINDGISHQNR